MSYQRNKNKNKKNKMKKAASYAFIGFVAVEVRVFCVEPLLTCGLLTRVWLSKNTAEIADLSILECVA